jgi:hypothetical protein
MRGSNGDGGDFTMMAMVSGQIASGPALSAKQSSLQQAFDFWENTP